MGEGILRGHERVGLAKAVVGHLFAQSDLRQLVLWLRGAVDSVCWGWREVPLILPWVCRVLLPLGEVVGVAESVVARSVDE